MGNLIIDCEPYFDESAMSYLIRALGLNGSSVRDALEHLHGHRRRHVCLDDASAFSQLTGVALDWFEFRLPSLVRGDRWQEIELFGRAWRNDWTMRGTHQQVCLECLGVSGYMRMEWDLALYPACHIHGTVLSDHCEACGRSVSPDRPAVDVCSCGRYLSGEARQALPLVVRWSRWVSEQLHKNEGSALDSDLDILNLVQGLSVDGGFRLLLAYGGGSQALRGCVLHGASAWLTSQDVHDVLGLASSRLSCGKGRPWAARTEVQRCADSLAEQKLRGITLADRAAAGQALSELGQKPRWRNRRPACHEQLSLLI